MSTIAIIVKTEAGVADLRRADSRSINKIQNIVDGIKSGALSGSISIQTSGSDPVAASATLTVTSAIATDAITIGAVTFTATSTPTLSTHWEIDGADDDADAASLTAAINAHAVIGLVVKATSLANVVTVRALQAGVVGNQIPISSADGTIVASSTFLASGAGGAAGPVVFFAR